MLAGTVAAEGAENGNSAATITASFGDSCSDFDAHSSKDISHVEIHRTDGRVGKDEAIDAPDFSIDGGDEIDLAIVKSGTTEQRSTATALRSRRARMASITTATAAPITPTIQDAHRVATTRNSPVTMVTVLISAPDECVSSRSTHDPPAERILSVTAQ